jgi:GNAT superfamily N-acetyltransferase
VTDTLEAILAAATGGRPPDADGRVSVIGPPAAGAGAAIVSFTGHHVVAADVPAAWVDERCPRWAFEAPFGAPFVSALADRVDLRAGTLDLVLVAHGTAPTDLDLVAVPADEAARLLAGAPNPRSDVIVRRMTDGQGLVLIGRGLEGRWEFALDVEPASRGRGLGRALASAARGLVGPGDYLFAQVAPGNVASVRAVLAAGFRPFAAEILFWDR